MEFQAGDKVVHCTHGPGQVMAIEKRNINDKTDLYYMVQVGNLTIWVPVDENTKSRLRFPATRAKFKKLLSILSSPAELLPDDRRQRNLMLIERLKDGRIETLCKVIRDLSSHRHTRTWSEYDTSLMKRAKNSLIREWSFTMAVTPHEAEAELQEILLERVN